MNRLIQHYLNPKMDDYFERLIKLDLSPGELKTLHDSILIDQELREIVCAWIKSLRSFKTKENI